MTSIMHLYRVDYCMQLFPRFFVKTLDSKLFCYCHKNKRFFVLLNNKIMLIFRIHSRNYPLDFCFPLFLTLSLHFPLDDTGKWFFSTSQFVGVITRDCTLHLVILYVFIVILHYSRCHGVNQSTATTSIAVTHFKGTL